MLSCFVTSRRFFLFRFFAHASAGSRETAACTASGNAAGRSLQRLALRCHFLAYNAHDRHQKAQNQESSRSHDKDGDGYYDMLSAMQKSIRGSDVQASLYYLAKLIVCDELDSICRRLAVIAYEDIGLANPMIGPKVMAAIDSALMLGLPEARIPLSSIVIEMALSPKSNSAETAIDKAIDAVNNIDAGDIPSYLKSPYIGYLYPHDYKNDYIKQQYLPDKIKNIKFYIPKDNKNEKILKDILDKLEK